MRYFFRIAYHGTNYSGWQKHAGVTTVQQVFEDSLSRIFKTTIAINGCGRTDANVHASQFFFHVDLDNAWDFDLLFRLNNVLPDDIAVFDIIPMEGQPHARFDAVQRSYDYFIHTYKDPFLSRFSSYYDIKDWNLTDMQRAADLLLKYDDYQGLCKTPTRNNTTICNISEAMLFVNGTGDKLRFRISANRFLGKMVRTIVGKLIDIGTGKLAVADFESLLSNPESAAEIKPAYPQGLYLSKVTYPYLDVPARTNFSQMLAGKGDTWIKV